MIDPQNGRRAYTQDQKFRVVSGSRLHSVLEVTLSWSQFLALPSKKERKSERERERRVGVAYADECRAVAAGPAEPEGPCLGWGVPRDPRVISVRQERRGRRG